jgi:hypothetical protein
MWLRISNNYQSQADCNSALTRSPLGLPPLSSIKAVLTSVHNF